VPHGSTGPPDLSPFASRSGLVLPSVAPCGLRAFVLHGSFVTGDVVEGGELCVLTGSEAIRIDLQRGGILVAPAWLLHTVAPVIERYRWSVVLQGHGRPWR
jgi:hypothetical protein